MRAWWISFALIAAVAARPLASRADAAAEAKSVPVQIRLAEEMAANADWEEAARRWIDILYYFGPSEYEARAEFELGALALRRGRSDLAAEHWSNAVTRGTDTEWAERARKGLQLLGKELPPTPQEPPPPYVTNDTPADERQFLISQALMADGLFDFAVRDFLKVPNLYPDSPRAPEARFHVGTCQALLGRPDLAIAQWRRVIADYPKSPQADAARAGIAAWQAALEGAGIALPDPGAPDAAWRPYRHYSTGPDRGLSYAEDLYENGNLTYALQEYAKVLCDLYTLAGEINPHRPYARYRMGVCAYRLGHPEAAARQWRRLLSDSPDSPFAGRASRALAAVSRTDALSSDAGREAPAVPTDLDSDLLKRFHLAGQLLDCELPLVAAKEYLKVSHVLTAGRPNPFQAEASYRLGVCQHLLGRPDLALAAWRKTIAAYPDSPWAAEAEKALAAAQDREATLSWSHPEAITP
jgi:TolA-binding protein